MELEKLIRIAKEWELDFKGDLFEGIPKDYHTVSEYINILIYDLFPIWISENPENIELYENYKYRISNLNCKKIEEELRMS